jgi:hypothetical protein
MQTVDETLSLLQRQVELETAMRQPGGIRITEEQQLPTCADNSSSSPQPSKP